MNSRRLHTNLQLAYSPISNYEFYFLKQEKIMQEILAESTLYVICQRTELSFENITFDEIEDVLHFEVHKKGSSTILKCQLPFEQRLIKPNQEKTVELEFGYL